MRSAMRNSTMPPAIEIDSWSRSQRAQQRGADQQAGHEHRVGDEQLAHEHAPAALGRHLAQCREEQWDVPQRVHDEEQRERDRRELHGRQGGAAGEGCQSIPPTAEA